MTCNIGAELAPHDAEIRRLFERDMAVVEQAFLGTIKRGQAEGSISKQHDPLQLARFLVVCPQGLQVTARAIADRARLDDAVATPYGDARLILIRGNFFGRFWTVRS